MIMGRTSLAVDPADADIGAEKGTYHVAVDHATLRVVDMGAKGTGYSIGLVGRIDDSWIRCFRSVQADSRLFSRFMLDPGAWTISFLRLPDDGPADVIGALQMLDNFVYRINRFVASLFARS
jgi:hypothetical protein